MIDGESEPLVQASSADVVSEDVQAHRSTSSYQLAKDRRPETATLCFRQHLDPREVEVVAHVAHVNHAHILSGVVLDDQEATGVEPFGVYLRWTSSSHPYIGSTYARMAATFRR